MKKIIVASKNPVKLEAVKQGFAYMFTDETFDVVGVSVSSDVADQPMSEQETWQGATNRATNAYKKYSDADFRVGLEGGLASFGNDLMLFDRIVIKGREKIGKARTATIFLPSKVAELVHQGMELGDADDIVFGERNSKQKNGAVGILTGNVIDRTKKYVDGIVMALVPFKHNDLY